MRFVAVLATVVVVVVAIVLVSRSLRRRPG